MEEILPAVPLLQDYLARAAHRFPDKSALVCGPERLDYRTLNARANALASGLVARGVRRGDRVMIFADNTPEVVIAFWAALKADAVACIVNPLTRRDKLQYLVRDCRPRALICEDRLKGTWSPALDEAPQLRPIVFGPRAAAETGCERWDDVMERNQGARPPLARNLDIDLAAIIYTSGSTGDPKGVMMSHRNMMTAATSISTYLGMNAHDVILCALPLAFDYGMYQMIMTIQVGGRLVLERSFAYPAQALKRMREEGVTGFPGVPTMFAMLTQLARAALDLPTLRFVSNTAAALPVKHIEQLQKLFPRAEIFSMYGLTECKRCTYLPPEQLAVRPTSVGIAIPNTELWLVDEHDQKVGPNTIGQLVIRGATVMQGYWEKPEQTARKLKPGPLPGERVLYTGDLCRLDDEGYLYFVGRMDDVIKSRGEKVPPKEVEVALMNVAGVQEAAVIGLPDELLGQSVCAFVVLEPGISLDAKQLQRACSQVLEPFMVPQQIHFVSELPRTDTGKVKKTSLCERIKNHEDSHGHPMRGA